MCSATVQTSGNIHFIDLEKFEIQFIASFSNIILDEFCCNLLLLARKYKQQDKQKFSDHFV